MLVGKTTDVGLLCAVDSSADKDTGIPWFMSLICSSETAHKTKTRKMKINFPLLPEKRHQEQ
jgi:hypothetical protein